LADLLLWLIRFVGSDDEPRVQALVQEIKVLIEKGKAASLGTEDVEDNESLSSNGSDMKLGESEVCNSLASQVACLMDLLPSMDNTLLHAMGRDRDGRVPATVKFQVSGPASSYIRSVYDKFSEADTKLVERLGEANWQRHTTIRLNREAPTETGSTISKPGLKLESRSSFVPVSKFHDSGLGSSIPTPINDAASVRSHSSFASSLGEEDTSTLRVPPTPLEVFDEKPFTCDYCGQLLTDIRSRIDWKYDFIPRVDSIKLTFLDDMFLQISSRTCAPSQFAKTNSRHFLHVGSGKNMSSPCIE
jgi:hypothetical protein